MSQLIRDLLKALPEGANPGWVLFVNGVEVPAREVSLVNPKFGEVRFGAAPMGGYGTWGFEEVGGGGSVLVPYVRMPDGNLYIGLVQQPRPFMSDTPVLNGPRGFLNLGETHFESAAREGLEEIGLDESTRVRPLLGAPGNPNSTFFITVGQNPDGSAKGIRFYGVQFTPSEVELDGDVCRFKTGVVKPLTPSAEKIMGTVFVPWVTAMQLGCLITNAGVGRLLATIETEAAGLV